MSGAFRPRHKRKRRAEGAETLNPLHCKRLRDSRGEASSPGNGIAVPESDSSPVSAGRAAAGRHLRSALLASGRSRSGAVRQGLALTAYFCGAPQDDTTRTQDSPQAPTSDGRRNVFPGSHSRFARRDIPRLPLAAPIGSVRATGHLAPTHVALLPCFVQDQTPELNMPHTESAKESLTVQKVVVNT